MIFSKSFAIACSLLAIAFLPLIAAEQQRDAATGSGGVVTSSRHPDLHPMTLVETLDVLRNGRRRAHQQQNEKREQNLGNPNGHLRRVQEDGDGGGTCQVALAEAEERLASCEAQAEGPSYLYVQMADECIFQTTDNGNMVLKSRRFHGDTVMFSDRPFTYEEEIPTESFFGGFDDKFNADNGGRPNAAVTLIQNDESRDVVVSVW